MQDLILIFAMVGCGVYLGHHIGYKRGWKAAFKSINDEEETSREAN